MIAVNQLANKIALITGASSGIGAGIAEAFGAAGAAVVVSPDGSDPMRFAYQSIAQSSLTYRGARS